MALFYLDFTIFLLYYHNILQQVIAGSPGATELGTARRKIFQLEYRFFLLTFALSNK